ncbi:SHOCT domain-containing protein [Paenibacillus sp. NFR01]|uniref:SHOCT domain-containing protein n=1 Tax=Paenibacillus sp. NFR01 TaxID=1566279 RepID=UPI0008C824BB|nr:SHOCT domain-containing protein [Paenibacillus sp. NFR01]SET26273.1 putative membrane protein [Paenibacillus sp. NFR01]
MMMGYGFGFGMFGLIINFLLIVGVIYLVIKWVRGDGSRNAGYNDNTPERILDERFARGEISEEEYFRMKSILRDRM